MNSDPQLLFYNFKVKYLKIMWQKYYEFLSSSFHWKKLFSKYLQKRRVLGYLPFNIYIFGSELWLKNYYLKSWLYMQQNCGVSKKSKSFEILVIYLLETW